MLKLLRILCLFHVLRLSVYTREYFSHVYIRRRNVPVSAGSGRFIHFQLLTTRKYNILFHFYFSTPNRTPKKIHTNLFFPKKFYFHFLTSAHFLESKQPCFTPSIYCNRTCICSLSEDICGDQFFFF